MILHETNLANPNIDTARYLRSRTNQELANGIVHVLEALADAGYRTESVKKLVRSLNTDVKFSAFLHVLNDRLLAYIDDHDVTGIQEILELAPEVIEENQDIRVFGWYLGGPSIPWAQYLFDACDQSFRETYNVFFDGENPSIEEYGLSKQALSTALECLSELDPTCYSELEAYLTDIAVFRSPSMNAASSMVCLGLVRVSQLREGQNWVRYLENLVHEAGHQHLNRIFLQDDLILNESHETFRSPLRKEPRPLSGILHALFVLGRTLRLQRLYDASRFADVMGPMASAYNNASNPASFEEKFEDCWSVLDRHAKLTPTGANLLHDVRDMAFGVN